MACRLYRRSITVSIETSRISSSRGSSARGALPLCRRGGPVHLLCSARLDGDPLLCDLRRDCYCVVDIFADRPLNG